MCELIPNYINKSRVNHFLCHKKSHLSDEELVVISSPFFRWSLILLPPWDKGWLKISRWEKYLGMIFSGSVDRKAWSKKKHMKRAFASYLLRLISSQAPNLLVYSCIHSSSCKAYLRHARYSQKNNRCLSFQNDDLVQLPLASRLGHSKSHSIFMNRIRSQGFQTRSLGTLLPVFFSVLKKRKNGLKKKKPQ